MSDNNQVLKAKIKADARMIGLSIVPEDNEEDIDSESPEKSKRIVK